MNGSIRKYEDRFERPDILEKNVQRLLERTYPQLTMPEEDKSRVLAMLKTRESRQEAQSSKLNGHATRGSFVQRIWPYLASTVTAVFILILTLVWPSVSGDAIAWPEVFQYLTEARTVTAVFFIEEISDTGERSIDVRRVYIKEPGKYRIEYLRTPEGTEVPTHANLSLESIQIIVHEGDSLSQTMLLPEIKVAQRNRSKVSNIGADDVSKYAENQVEKWWELVKTFTSDNAHRIDERKIEGSQCIGFEVDIMDIDNRPPFNTPGSFVRVWADSLTAVPIQVEVEFHHSEGGIISFRIEEIAWNTDLPDDLFDVDMLAGWTIYDQMHEKRRFIHTSLKTGVTLRIGPADGALVITEKDVLSCDYGIATQSADFTHKRTMVYLTLKAEAAERMEAFTTKHVGKKLPFDFNDEIRLEPRIYSPLNNKFGIDISSLGISLEQFEHDYLVAPEETESR